MNVTVKELINVLKGELILGDPKTVTKRAVVDSRAVVAGDLFFALKGERTDGHDYVRIAASQGATAAVVSRLDWLGKENRFQSSLIRVESPLLALQALAQWLRAKFNGPVVGITGSNGKTTTKQMVASVLKVKGAGLFTKGNFNSQIGLPMVLSELSPEDQWMVLEMGASEAGNLTSLSQLAKPLVGVITSIGMAHLQTFGSIEKVARAKWELIESLPSDGYAILPWGDQYLEPLIRSYNRKIIYFGEDSACASRASGVETGETVRFTLNLGGRSKPVCLPVAGRFNVHNALAAAAVGHVLGLDIDQIVYGLETFEPPKMRMEILRHPSGAVIINDAYNANPSSMLQSVRSMMEAYRDHKKVLVLGSMLELGSDSNRMHFHVGTEIAKMPLQAAYLYGEEMSHAHEGVVSAGGDAKKIQMASSIPNIVEGLRSHLKDGTVVLLKGSRGMKLEQVIEGLR